MEIIDLGSKIDKWEQSSNNFKGNILDGEKQGFLLYPHHPVLKSIFKITANIYITNEDTDFILDVDLTTLSAFDIDTDIPTTKDLYQIYLAARKDWNKKILEESLKNDIIIQRNEIAPQFEELKPYLDKAINNAYRQN